jgi:FKBP-type peptidyl-prolyl cis-trans isomerase FkpA
MSKIKFYFILSIATVITIISCNKDDNNADVTPPLPYAEQYPKDIAAIEGYLNTHYIKEVLNNPGFPDDQDVTIAEIPTGGNQSSLMSYLNSPTLPRLTSRDVITSNEINSPLGGVTYKIYTLVIREGVGNNGIGGEYPCNMDAVFAGYKGTLLNGSVFDSSNNGQLTFDLSSTGIIRGWSEAFPQFKTGWVSSNADGTIRYNDFGVGVMFLPSAMGYYNNPPSTSSIAAYSPLVFSIKLYALKRLDHDSDGISDFQEDVDLLHDRYMYYFAAGIVNKDDSDRDGIPDFLDIDDDNDTYATRGEIKDKNGTYYPFDKIPDCSGNQDNPERLKRHLDKNCIKMNQ